MFLKILTSNQIGTIERFFLSKIYKKKPIVKCTHTLLPGRIEKRRRKQEQAKGRYSHEEYKKVSILLRNIPLLFPPPPPPPPPLPQNTENKTYTVGDSDSGRSPPAADAKTNQVSGQTLMDNEVQIGGCKTV